MKENFDKAMKFVFKWEGGYSNDLDDPGGETNWGISKRAHSDLDIKSLTIQDAKAIYKTEYWDKVKGDELPYPFDLICLDTAINLGVKRCLELVNLDCEDWKDLLFYRINYYCNLNNPKYLRGWINRVVDLWNYVK